MDQHRRDEVRYQPPNVRPVAISAADARIGEDAGKYLTYHFELGLIKITNRSDYEQSMHAGHCMSSKVKLEVIGNFVAKIADEPNDVRPPPVPRTCGIGTTVSK